MKQNMLNINQITKQYHDGKDKRGISEISFSVKEGEIVCILGASGSGKTTLIRTIAGLEILDSGTIQIAENIHPSYVAQDYTLWPHLNILENLTLAPILKGEDKQVVISEAKKLLNRFELQDYSEKYPIELSGGQKQRIALLRAVMSRSKILLLDEITSALDPVLVKSVLELVKELANENYTMIIVTHHITFAQSIADRILFLRDGSLFQNMTVSDFFHNQSDKEIQSFIKDFSQRDIIEHIS